MSKSIRGKGMNVVDFDVDGEKHFSDGENELPFQLKDFWSWYASNLLNAPLRGAVAEYIVAKALGDNEPHRNVWASYDLLYNGCPIEVKSSAYLQAHESELLSRVSFSIDKHNHYEPLDSAMETKRHSSLYVFCLYSCKDRAEANPMRMEQWLFYIVPTSVIEERLGDQRSLSFRSLLKLQPVIASYGTLKSEIDKLCQMQKQ